VVVDRIPKSEHPFDFDLAGTHESRRFALPDHQSGEFVRGAVDRQSNDNAFETMLQATTLQNSNVNFAMFMYGPDARVPASRQAGEFFALDA
jgi:hypothetical protein